MCLKSYCKGVEPIRVLAESSVQAMISKKYGRKIPFNWIRRNKSFWGAHTVVDPGHLHHSPNLCQNYPSSSSAACLVSASSSPFFPSKRHCRSHKRPSLWKDPWIWVALPIGKMTNDECSSFESMETSNNPRTSS
jgi:hypothetical protein